MLLKSLQNSFKIPQLRKKILFTLAMLVIYKAGGLVIIPGIDSKALLAYWTGPKSGIFELYDMFAGGNFSKVTIFALGITPYISASILILLMSGVVPYLKRLRDGTIEQNNIFDRLIYGMTALICATQAWSLATFWESIGSPSGSGLSIVPHPGWVFRLLAVLTITSGTMFLVWVADLITERGIANGVALMIIVNIISEVPYIFRREYGAFLVSGKTLLQALQSQILTSAVLLALIVLSIFIVSAKRSIPLQYIKQTLQNRSTGNLAPTIPLRVNAVGIIPIKFAQLLILSFTTWIFSFKGPKIESQSVLYWIIYCGLIIFLTYLYTAVTFSPKDLVNRIKQYGYAIAEMGSDEEMTDYIDRIMERTILPGAIFLCGIAAAPLALENWLGVRPHTSKFFGPSLLIISAVCIDAVQHVRTHLKMYAKVEGDDNQKIVDWAPVFTGETNIDGEMVRGILHHAGIDSVGFSNRVISAVGTLALWEASRPTVPSLTIHRRLGKGQVVVQVPSDRVEEAQAILESQHIVSK